MGWDGMGCVHAYEQLQSNQICQNQRVREGTQLPAWATALCRCLRLLISLELSGGATTAVSSRRFPTVAVVVYIVIGEAATLIPKKGKTRELGLFVLWLSGDLAESEGKAYIYAHTVTAKGTVIHFQFLKSMHTQI